VTDTVARPPVPDWIRTWSDRYVSESAFAAPPLRTEPGRGMALQFLGPSKPLSTTLPDFLRYKERERWGPGEEAPPTAGVADAAWSSRLALLNGDIDVDEWLYLRHAINRSRWLLELQDDWDDAGATRYTQDVWQRAETFIFRSAKQFRDRVGLRAPEPKVLPGPRGSIDVEWTWGNRRLYINVPIDDAALSYYGDDRGVNRIEGTTEANTTNYWLLAWLMQ